MRSGRPQDKCGVVGVASRGDAAMPIYLGLRAIQHRGQESVGISTFSDRIHSHKAMGLVHEAFSQEKLLTLSGATGIGHVRYSTEGGSELMNAQPVVVTSLHGDLALAHNGEITNTEKIKEKLSKKGWAFVTSSDTEVIVRLLANELIETKGDMVKAIKDLMGQMDGSYSLVILFQNKVYAVRDPLGIKPLCLGKIAGASMAASESCAIDTLEGVFIRDVAPGEIVTLTTDDISKTRVPTPKNTAHCMFEWVYFARADSKLDGRLAYDVRREIGRTLAREHPVEADVVVPVPDSGRTHAIGYSEQSGIPYAEGLMKNRYVFRTFIMPDNSSRQNGVHLKLNPVRGIIEGKSVVLCDDSIVRGNTTRRLVGLLKKFGAREVHVRVGCPPISSPCFLGIDMKTKDQFIANGRTPEEIAKILEADSVEYVSIDGLVNAIGKKADDLCLGCLTAEYPVKVKGQKERFQKNLNGY